MKIIEHPRLQNGCRRNGSAEGVPVVCGNRRQGERNSGVSGCAYGLVIEGCRDRLAPAVGVVIRDVAGDRQVRVRLPALRAERQRGAVQRDFGAVVHHVHAAAARAAGGHRHGSGRAVEGRIVRGIADRVLTPQVLGNAVVDGGHVLGVRRIMIIAAGRGRHVLQILRIDPKTDGKEGRALILRLLDHRVDGVDSGIILFAIRKDDHRLGGRFLAQRFDALSCSVIKGGPTQLRQAVDGLDDIQCAVMVIVGAHPVGGHDDLYLVGTRKTVGKLDQCNPVVWTAIVDKIDGGRLRIGESRACHAAAHIKDEGHGDPRSRSRFGKAGNRLRCSRRFRRRFFRQCEITLHLSRYRISGGVQHRHIEDDIGEIGRQRIDRHGIARGQGGATAVDRFLKQELRIKGHKRIRRRLFGSLPLKIDRCG